MASTRATHRAATGKGGGKPKRSAAPGRKADTAPQAPQGRPSEFTADVEKAILDALAAGSSVRAACEAAGIGTTTFYRWCSEGEGDSAPEHFRAFRDGATRARAQARVVYAAIIRRAANDGDWRAAAWYLERSEPEEWAPKQKLEHSGPGGGPIQATEPTSGQIDPRKLTSEQRMALAEMLDAQGQ